MCYADWVHSCPSFQAKKVNCHHHSPILHISLPYEAFSHIHVNLVSPLSSSHHYAFLFTGIDRLAGGHPSSLSSSLGDLTTCMSLLMPYAMPSILPTAILPTCCSSMLNHLILLFQICLNGFQLNAWRISSIYSHCVVTHSGQVSKAPLYPQGGMGAAVVHHLLWYGMTFIFYFAFLVLYGQICTLT